MCLPGVESNVVSSGVESKDANVSSGVGSKDVSSRSRVQCCVFRSRVQRCKCCVFMSRVQSVCVLNLSPYFFSCSVVALLLGLVVEIESHYDPTWTVGGDEMITYTSSPTSQTSSKSPSSLSDIGAEMIIRCRKTGLFRVVLHCSIFLNFHLKGSIVCTMK